MQALRPLKQPGSSLEGRELGRGKEQRVFLPAMPVARERGQSWELYSPATQQPAAHPQAAVAPQTDRQTSPKCPWGSVAQWAESIIRGDAAGPQRLGMVPRSCRLGTLIHSQPVLFHTPLMGWARYPRKGLTHNKAAEPVGITSGQFPWRGLGSRCCFPSPPQVSNLILNKEAQRWLFLI